jgi:hypothetical protein
MHHLIGKHIFAPSFELKIEFMALVSTPIYILSITSRSLV